MRDALLLHQAMEEMKSDRENSVLLSSRIVRLHWVPDYLELVRSEYHRKFNQSLGGMFIRSGLFVNIDRPESDESYWGDFCNGLLSVRPEG